MKRFYNYTFRAVCIYLVILIISVFSTTKSNVQVFDRNVLNSNISKEFNSLQLLEKNRYGTCPVEKEELVLKAKEEEKKEEKKEQQEKEDVKEKEVEVKSTPTPLPTSTPSPTVEPTSSKPNYVYVQTVDTTNFPVISTASGNISHYGHDCYGCTSGKTATGYDISDGRIYYTDPTYGSVRIVAAGWEYPYGTILRISNSSTPPIIAIVLDRGGSIGSGKKYFLDLLTESNASAYSAGVKYNMTVEVLRMGY